MRRLPPEVPYGSLLVKLTPGTWFSAWNRLWPDVCVSRYSPESVTRDFGAVWSFMMPIVRTLVADTTTSDMSSSTASVPVDCASAFCATTRA